MRGKVGLVIGLAAGYVLGTRAGRERYEQIKAQVDKVWNLEPVQEQVTKAKDFAKSTAMALPSTLWDSAVKVTKAAGSKGTPGQKLDSAIRTGKQQVDDVSAAAETLGRRGEGCRGRRVRRHRESRRRAPQRSLTVTTPRGFRDRNDDSLLTLVGEIPELIRNLVIAEVDAGKAWVRRTSKDAGYGAGWIVGRAVLPVLVGRRPAGASRSSGCRRGGPPGVGLAGGSGRRCC